MGTKKEAKKEAKKKEVDPRDTFDWLYTPVTVDESKGYKNGSPQYKNPSDDVIDRKIEQFVENGVKFICHSCEIPTNQLGKTIKHEIVMTLEAFNKLSATQKKLFMGGN